MAEAVVADLAKALILKLVTLAAEEVIQAWKVHEDLETLREVLESINALLSDAATKKLKLATVRDWFKKLEAVARLADAFMDKLSDEVARRKEDKSHRVRDFFTPSKNTILYRFKVAHKIKAIHASFDKNLQWANKIGLCPVGHLMLIEDTDKTPPSKHKSQLVGRDEDISSLAQIVCKNHQEDLQVIAIVGSGGQGKTALARAVYYRDDVIDMFPKRMAVTAPDDFDATKILNEMVESITSKQSALINEEGLIKVLRDKLKGDKFLLFLDNVWNENLGAWDNLKNSLDQISGARGSIILVTTRSQKVVDVMRCSSAYPLKNLSADDSLKLLMREAFSPGKCSNTKAFEDLGREMVKKCGGLPLAINALGRLLSTTESEQEWLDIQSNDIWASSEGVLSSLRVTYDKLPSLSLKQCFTYCSIIPKGSVIYKNELIQNWMALGFLLPPGGSTAPMEDIGNGYFNILLKYFLLHDVEKDEVGNITRCKMHDLVHDLALDLCEHQLVTEGPELEHISKAIYMRLDKGVSNIKPTMLKINSEKVQLLHLEAHIFGDVFPHLKHLTALVLNTDEYIEKLPSWLSNIKFLKYLDISCFRSTLPSYIMELSNLQALRVWKLNESPTDFCKLTKLRHLHVKKELDDENDEDIITFNGIENLTCLQTLPQFVVSRNDNCLVGELGRLDNLRGTLDLYGLGDMINFEEASKARLCRKSKIQHLRLNWRTVAEFNYRSSVYIMEEMYRDNDGVMEKLTPPERKDKEYTDEKVMEGLKPHPNLKGLEIVNFMGYKFASWITMMTNLVIITLRDCESCKVLPPLGHLSKLREMKIIDMVNLEVIGSDFNRGLDSGGSMLGETGAVMMYPSLRMLILKGLKNVKNWVEPVMSSKGEDQSIMLAFPRLEELEIDGCSKLTRIPDSSYPSLKKLKINFLESSSMVLETICRKASSLEHVKLMGIRQRQEGSFLPPPSNTDSNINGLLKNNSLSLIYLDLAYCEGLTHLTRGVALEKLRLFQCHALTSINVVEGSRCLTDLSIVGCDSLPQCAYPPSLSLYKGIG